VPPRPVPFATARPPPESTITDTVENSVCSKRPTCSAGCSSMACQGTDQVWHWSCAGLGARSGQCGACTGAPSATGPSVRRGPLGGPAACGWAERHAGRRPRASTESDGTTQGERYYRARGEILRPPQDPRRRRRSARLCSSIKNESPGSKDDQTPS